MNLPDELGYDGAWVMLATRRTLTEHGYEPSPHGPDGWWVSPTVAFVSRRLGHLPLSEDIAGFLDGGDPLGPRLVQHAGPTYSLTGRMEMVRCWSRWDACVALLAHVRADDLELVALATLLHATGRVEALP